MTPGPKKKKEYFRQCIRCDSYYKTTHKFSKICPKCYLPIIITRNQKFLWPELMKGLKRKKKISQKKQ